MASLGVRTVNEMIGRTELLKAKESGRHWKARGVDLSRILKKPDMPESVGRYRTQGAVPRVGKITGYAQAPGISASPAIEGKEPVDGQPAHPSIPSGWWGTILGNEITKRYGDEGLPGGYHPAAL